MPPLIHFPHPTCSWPKWRRIWNSLSATLKSSTGHTTLSTDSRQTFKICLGAICLLSDRPWRARGGRGVGTTYNLTRKLGDNVYALPPTIPRVEKWAGAHMLAVPYRGAHWHVLEESLAKISNLIKQKPAVTKLSKYDIDIHRAVQCVQQSGRNLTTTSIHVKILIHLALCKRVCGAGCCWTTMGWRCVGQLF